MGQNGPAMQLRRRHMIMEMMIMTITAMTLLKNFFGLVWATSLLLATLPTLSVKSHREQKLRGNTNDELPTGGAPR